MKSYIHFLMERDMTGEHPFERNKSIGWWGDKDHIEVYHGTHKRNLDSVKKNGLDKADHKTGFVSTTLDPQTAHGYAAMSGAGGEHDFRKAGAKPVTTPHEDRVTVKFRIPKDWLHKNMDHDYGGNNLGDAKKRMTSKEHYHDWKAKNPGKTDSEYYTATEFRTKPIPPEFYAGHSFKAKKPN